MNKTRNEESAVRTRSWRISKSYKLAKHFSDTTHFYKSNEKYNGT